MFRGAQEDLFVATRASRSEPFGQATQLTTLNSPNLDDFASVTADGLTMYFASTRDNYFSIYKSDRASLASSFSAPKEVRELYVRGEGNPYVTPDGGVLYFHSNRNNNLDIFRATKKATGEFDTPELLPFNTINHDEQNVVVSPDELTIYFRRWGDPTATVWMSTRTSVAEAFGEAVALPELSDPFQGASPTWISPDGCRLYLQEVDPGLGFWVYVAEHTGGSGGSTGSGGGGTGGSSGTGGIGGTVGSGSLGTGGAAGTGGVTRICTSAQPFGAPTEVPGLNGDAHGVISARFSPDELTAYLGIFNGPQQDTFVATRNSRSEPFGTPIPQYTLNTLTFDDFASATADGLTIYFESTRLMHFSMFVSTRTSVDAYFPAPRELTELYVFGENNPYVTPDGSALYYCTPVNGNAEIYRAQKTATGFAVGQAVSVNSQYEEVDPVVSPDELTIYFRRRGDPSGPDGVWMATRTSITEAFGRAVSLPGLSIPNALTAPTWISPDGCRLYLQEYVSGQFWVDVAERTGN